MNVISILFLAAISVFSTPKESEVEIVANIEKEEGSKTVPLDGLLSVYTGGELVKEVKAESSGQIPSFTVSTGKQYVLKVSKDGFVTKIAHLDAVIKDLKNAPRPLYFAFQATLFERLDGVDYSYIESNPVALFEFDSKYFFRYDKKHAAQMQQKVEKIRANLAQ